MTAGPTDQWHLFEINKHALGLLIPPPRLPRITSGPWKDATAFCCPGGQCLSQGCRLNWVERGVLEALLRRPGHVQHPTGARVGGTGKLPGSVAKAFADHPPSPPHTEKLRPSNRRFLLGSLGTCSSLEPASPLLLLQDCSAPPSFQPILIPILQADRLRNCGCWSSKR